MATPNPDRTYTPPRITFSSRNLAPDVLLRVFDQEFAVHSGILKVHSGFFAKFLDSVDKAPVSTGTHGNGSGRKSAGFTYCWVTKVDGKNEWSLVADNSKNEPYSLKSFTGRLKDETEMFGYLLKAFYNQSYEIYRFDQFEKLVRMADYYCALPILSRSLDSTMQKSCFFSWAELNEDALTTLNLAVRLRNATLFRECMIHLSGPWREPRFWDIEDRKLQKVAWNAHNQICTKICRFEEVLHQLTHKDLVARKHLAEPGHEKSKEYEEDLSGKSLAEIVQVAREGAHKKYTDEEGNEQMQLSMPIFYRNLLKSTKGYFQDCCLDMDFLDSNLQIAKLRPDIVGKRWWGYSDYFLCAEIEDEDLPWDINEKEW